MWAYESDLATKSSGLNLPSQKISTSSNLWWSLQTSLPGYQHNLSAEMLVISCPPIVVHLHVDMAMR